MGGGAPPSVLPPQEERPAYPPASAKVHFVKDIAPIIQKSCFSCHGGEKGGKNGKGGLKLTTKALALKGGDGGSCIEPGKPEASSFYTLLIEKDPKKRMPDKAKPLPKEQIESVRRWIADGADWPDGYDFKK